MDNETVIRLNKVSKEYRIYQSNKEVIAHELFGMDAGTPQFALDEVSFDVKKGENVALIGGGRSGKTSLIRILAGIVKPTSGSLEVEGKVASTITFGVGFDMEMTGRENIYIKGMLLGWPKEKIKAEESAIIEFSELEKVIDYKMKTYSPAEVGRLGLTMFTATEADIYVFDCPFVVGDKAKREKCMARLKELSDDPEKTIVLVNNFLPFGYQLCQRGIVLDGGKVVFDGKVRPAVKFFKDSVGHSEEDDEDEEDIRMKGRKNKSYDQDDQVDDTGEI